MFTGLKRGNHRGIIRCNQKMARNMRVQQSLVHLQLLPATAVREKSNKTSRAHEILMFVGIHKTSDNVVTLQSSIVLIVMVNDH